MPLSDEKHIEEPLHSGEVFHLWSYLHHSKNLMVTLQIFVNHTEDHKFREFLEDVRDECFKEEGLQIETILKEAGIRLPPAPPDRPHVNVQDIPAGAKFQDSEIAYLVHHVLQYKLSMCSHLLGISHQPFLREIFQQFYEQKCTFTNKLSVYSKNKGWIVPPPTNIK